MSQNPLPKDTILFGDKGTYQIEQVIGHGGFGITYRAAATGSGLPDQVAIKEFFPKEMCARTAGTYDVIINSIDKIDTINQLRDRFVKESRNIQTCNHPSIVKVLDTIEMNGTAYMVMELIKGCTLKEYQSSLSTLSPGLASKIILEAAFALKYIHDKKITHLDVKPDNIMVTIDLSRVVLIDFGLSRQFREDGSSDSQVLAAVSKGYAAPEQYYGITRFSPESDIYSLGATLYKLVTGKTPPEPRILVDNPSALQIPAAIPAEIGNTIRAAMVHDRKNRLQSADQFIDMLKGKNAVTPPVPTKLPEYKDNDVDDDNPRSDMAVKFIFNIVLAAIIGIAAFYIKDNWSMKWQKFNYFFHQTNSEFIMSLAGICGVAIVGIIARSRAFKIAVTLISAIALAGLLVNTL